MGKTKLVYRVEHIVNASGPYCDDYLTESANNLRYKLRYEHGFDDEHPGPDRDGLPRPRHEDKFGFASLAQLRAWFDGWGQELAENGFLVSVYRIPAEDVQHGGRQVMFRKNLANFPIKRLSPVRLLAV